jgi:RNA polymerase sigma factor (TIGR02999 family)
MRFVVVDYVRHRTADKRGGEDAPLPLDPQRIGESPVRIGALLDLDDALDHLETTDERAARVVECRFFGGLTVEETAEALQCSPRTVKRDWRKARLLLYRHLHPRDNSADE